MKNNPVITPGRREFILTSLKAAGALTLFPGTIAASTGYIPSRREYRVQDLIDIILKEIPGAPFPQTVDTIKAGSAGNQVSGIVTTMFATLEVIRATIKAGADFIIAHEPTYYNHLDKLNYVPDNEIVKEKLSFLQQHNITIWRFHDYWHSCKPDGIGYGVLRNMGWLDYYQAGRSILQIPGTNLGSLLSDLKQKLGIEHLRYIGDLSQPLSRIALLPGAAGGQTQISIVEKEKPDVLIVGELSEWETAEYIRDARALGSKTTLVVLGHSVSEEPGMEWLVEWLRPKAPGLPITHIASGNPFSWV